MSENLTSADLLARIERKFNMLIVLVACQLALMAITFVMTWRLLARIAEILDYLSS